MKRRPGKHTGRPVGHPSRILDTILIRSGDGSTTEQQLVDALCQQIELGNSIRGSCGVVGLSVAACNEWVARGREDLAAKRATVYATFAVRIERARGVCRRVCLEQISKAAETDWRAAAWKLERQFFDEYGPRESVELTGDAAPMVPVIVLPMWMRQKAERIAAREERQEIGAPVKQNLLLVADERSAKAPTAHTASPTNRDPE